MSIAYAGIDGKMICDIIARYMKFDNLTPTHSSSGLASLTKDLHWVLSHALGHSHLLHVVHGARETPVPGFQQQGLHHHDDWELFFAMRGAMRFEVAGRPPETYAKGSILIAPPECLHAASELPQTDDLRVLVIHIPNKSRKTGVTDHHHHPMGLYSALSVDQFTKWTELLGDTPGSIIEKVAHLATGNTWEKEHALGLLRILLSTYAGMTTSIPDRHDSTEHRVSEALAFVLTHYCEASLSLPQVAAAAGLSVSRLSSIFRQSTGHSVRQAMIDIRLRRAMTLIKQSRYPLKEIAHLTGWSNQLYFSAAFRKRYARPPSSFRPPQRD